MVGTMTTPAHRRAASMPSSSFVASSPSALTTGGKMSNIRVVTRIRPLLQGERQYKSDLLAVDLEVSPDLPFVTPSKKMAQASSEPTPIISNTSSDDAYGNASGISASKENTQKNFCYDAAFGPQASQKEVYDRSVGDAVRRNIFCGYNTTIVAYGQSGSGKTFTLSGLEEAKKMATSPPRKTFLQTYEFKEPPETVQEEDGIIPRALHDLFAAKKQYQDDELSEGEVTLAMTYMEIYQDELRDLMLEHDQASSALKLRDSGDGGFFVEGLVSVVVKSVKHARDLIDAASTKRRTSSTKLNDRSSRSHVICTLTVTITPPRVAAIPTSDIITAKLTLVDLAGSERIKQSGVTGVAQKESININKDLFVLAKVVSALADKKIHVPYRDSKLTRVLRDSLGGNCCTVVVACVSPSDDCYEESMNTLRYAERSRTITNSVKQNVVKAMLTPAECAALRGENKALKVKLSVLRKRVNVLEQPRTNPSATHSLLDDIHSTFDELCMDPSGETEMTASSQSSLGSPTNSERSGIEGQAVIKKRATAEAAEASLRSKGSLMDQSDSISETSLRSKGSLLDLSDGDAEFFETSTDEVVESEKRIGRSLKSENNSLRMENKNLMDQISARQNEIKQYEQQATLVRHEMVRVESVLQRQQKRFEPSASSAFHRVVKAAPGQAIEMADLSNKPAPPTLFHDESETLRSKLIEAEAAAKNLEVSLACANAQVSQLKTVEISLQEEIEQLREDVKREEREREQSERDLDLLVDEAEVLTTERNEARSDADKHKEEKKELRSQLHVQSELVTELRGELEIKQKELEHQEQTGCKYPYDESKPNDADAVQKEEEEEEESSVATNDSKGSVHKDIRIQAAKMLFYANQAIEKGRSGRSVASCSIVSGNASEYKPDMKELHALMNQNRRQRTERAVGKPPLFLQTGADASNNMIVISNIDKISDPCSCESSFFSGNSLHAEFYLPKLGMACKCGNSASVTATLDGSDPCALGNILRPWQVDFLATMGIHGSVDLVHAFKERGGELAKAMRKWRKENKQPAIKTKSCHIALHVWSRTCKCVVHAVRKQKAEGATVITRPEFLEISSDVHTISTLGYGSKAEMGEI